MSTVTHRILIAAALSFAFVCAAWTFSERAGAAPAAAHATEQDNTFTIDAVHSAAIFEVLWQNMTPFYGQFTDFSGTVSYDGKSASSFACDITIPVESIDTHNQGRDRHLKSPDFFNAAEFPNINFKSTSLTDNGDGSWTVKGDLTMRGQSKPIEARLTRLERREGERGTRCGFATEFAIKRTDWGVSYGAGQGLSDEVRLMIAIQSAAQ